MINPTISGIKSGFDTFRLEMAAIMNGGESEEAAATLHVCLSQRTNTNRYGSRGWVDYQPTTMSCNVTNQPLRRI